MKYSSVHFKNTNPSVKSGSCRTQGRPLYMVYQVHVIWCSSVFPWVSAIDQKRFFKRNRNSTLSQQTLMYICFLLSVHVVEVIKLTTAAFVVRLWLCTFTLAVSAGAVLLLPISIVSNEVLLLYPKSYYVQWLNSSLIHGQYCTAVQVESISAKWCTCTL